MRKFFSVSYPQGAFDFALLLLRIAAGGLMVKHGYDKFIHFNDTASHMMNFMGIGQKASAVLVIFAEFFCSIFVMIGLFTRLACIPLIVTMSVALFMAEKGDFFGGGQVAALFLTAFIVLLFTGPGRVSVDKLISK